MARTNSKSPDGTGSETGAAGGSSFVDPADLDGVGDEITAEPDTGNDGGAASADGPGKRRRKRRSSGTGQKATPLSVEGIEGVLLSVHVMLAGMTQTPELVLSEPEGRAMAQALANVARHYPSFPITQELQDWIALGVVCVRVYSTRAIAIGIRKNRAKNAVRAGTVDGNIVKPTGLWPAAQPAPIDEGTKH